MLTSSENYYTDDERIKRNDVDESINRLRQRIAWRYQNARNQPLSGIKLDNRMHDIYMREEVPDNVQGDNICAFGSVALPCW